jgi:hypothetical protein
MIMADLQTDLPSARAFLVEVLGRGDLPQIVGIWDDLSDHDRAFMTVTACCVVIEHLIVIMSNYRRELAQEGFDALIPTVREHIDLLCAVGEPEAKNGQ